MAIDANVTLKIIQWIERWRERRILYLYWVWHFVRTEMIRFNERVGEWRAKSIHKVKRANKQEINKKEVLNEQVKLWWDCIAKRMKKKRSNSIANTITMVWLLAVERQSTTPHNFFMNSLLYSFWNSILSRLSSKRCNVMK